MAENNLQKWKFNRNLIENSKKKSKFLKNNLQKWNFNRNLIENFQKSGFFKKFKDPPFGSNFQKFRLRFKI